MRTGKNQGRPSTVGGMPKPWTVPKLAELLDVSPLTLYRLIREDRLKGVVHLGRKVLIPQNVVESLTRADLTA